MFVGSLQDCLLGLGDGERLGPDPDLFMSRPLEGDVDTEES